MEQVIENLIVTNMMTGDSVGPLERLKDVIKCIMRVAQIGSEDVDGMNFEQLNAYIETLQVEAMIKYMLMDNTVD
jgi:hypothetical protein